MEYRGHTTTATELGHLNGVTPAIQAQINGKIVGTKANTQIAVGNGTNTVAGGSNFTFNNTLFNVAATSVASTAEQVFKMTISEDANSEFRIENGTPINGIKCCSVLIIHVGRSNCWN